MVVAAVIIANAVTVHTEKDRNICDNCRRCHNVHFNLQGSKYPFTKFDIYPLHSQKGVS